VAKVCGIDVMHRHHIQRVTQTIQYFGHCRKFDIMDSMLHKLEKYADNLESIVEQRTAELMDEKQKTDMLLHRMLPT